MRDYLEVTFSDGSTFRVFTWIIAGGRARYYATRESDNDPIKYSTIFEEEYQYALNSPSELLDWSSNNMNLADVRDYMVQTLTKEIDRNEEWPNAQTEIISKVG